PNGLYRFYYKPFAQPALQSTLGNMGICTDGNGGVWVGGKNSPLFHLQVGQQEMPVLAEWRLRAAYLAPDNTVWIGEGNSGLWHETLSKVRPTEKSDKWSEMRNEIFNYTGRSWDFIPLPPEVAGLGEFVQAITQDRKGGLWVSFGRYGLYRYA